MFRSKGGVQDPYLHLRTVGLTNRCNRIYHKTWLFWGEVRHTLPFQTTASTYLPVFV